ncbi:hypothetical protein B0A55_04143 [Friedmanniomyces simplex]|uniref:Uncharacterized protein n=1 Tax=Friedmanniomyces simplex TaxID=329884 RepID=A0A4U0XX89_9PEZI|nr:hypothetical protein B0A55_04143 [Friedmanniomyces simplex]
MAPKLTDYLIQQEAQSKVTEAYEAVFHTKYLRKSFEEVLQQHKEFNGVHGVQQGQIDVEDTVVNTALITDILSLRRIRDQGLKDAKTELSQLSHDICAQMQLFAPESSAVEHEDVAITRQVRRAVAVFQHKTHGVQTSAEVEGLEHTLTQAVHSTLRASELYSLDKLQELMGDLREEWTLPVMVERLMRVAEDLKAAKQRIARRDGALERRKQQHDTTLKESNEISAAYEKLKGRYEELGKTRTHLQQRIGQLETERATMMTKTEHQQRLTEAGDHIRESAKTRAEETESQHAKGLSELEARLSEKHASAVKALNRRIGDAQLRTISADSGRDVWKRQAEEHRRSLLDEQTDRRTEAGLRAQGDEHKNTLIKELQVRIDEKNNQIDQLRKHNDTLDSNAVELKQRLELEQGEYLGARAEMEAFKASAGQQRLKDDAAISALTVERDGLRSRLQKLEEDCKLRDTQIEELGCKLSTTAEGEAEWKSKAEAAETVCKESTDQRDDLRASLVAARSQADTLMHEVNGHVKSVSNADGMLREKRQALADTLRKLGDTQRQLATTENAHGVLRFEVEELGQAKAQSERTLTSMDDRFRQALAAKEKLVVETGSSLNEAVEAKEKLAVELGALQQVNTELKSSLGEALAAKEQLAVETGSSLNEAVEAKEKLAAELGALQQVNTELKSSLSDLEEAKNNLAAEMDSSLNEAVEAKEKLAVELGALQQVNTDLKSRRNEVEEAKNNLAAAMDSSLNEAVEAKEKLAAEANALEQANADLESRRNEAVTAKKKLAAEADALTQAKTDLESNLNEAVTAKNNLAAEANALQQANADLESRRNEAVTAKKKLAAEADALTQAKTDLESNLNEAVTAKNNLAAEANALQQANADLESRRNEAVTAKKKLAAEADALTQAKTDLESNLNEAVTAKNNLAAEANALQQANADLESRRNEAVTAKKKLAAEADALTQAKTDLESNLNEAVTAKNNLAAEANALQQANADLESRRNEAVTAKNRLAAEADALTQAKTTTDGTLANVLGKLGLDERPRDSLVQRAEGLSEQIEGHKAAVQEANNKLNQLESSTSQGYSKYESQQRALLGAVRPVLTDAPQDPISAHSAKPMVAAVCALPNDHDEVEPLQLAVQDDCTLVFKSGEQHPTGSPSRLLARKLWLHACCETDDDLAVCALIDVLRARSYHTPQDPSEIGRTEGDMLVHAFRQYVARAESYASHEQHNEPSVARVCSWAAQCLELIIRYAGPLLQAEAREQYAKLSTIVAGLETPSLLLRAMMQWLQQALHAPATAVSLLHILANETDTLRGAAPTWAEYEKRVYERTVIVDGDDVLILVPDGPTVQRWPKDALAYKQPDLHVQGLYTKSSHSLANPPGVAFVTRHTGDAWWFFAEHYPDN